MPGGETVGRPYHSWPSHGGSLRSAEKGTDHSVLVSVALLPDLGVASTAKVEVQCCSVGRQQVAQLPGPDAEEAGSEDAHLAAGGILLTPLAEET